MGLLDNIGVGILPEVQKWCDQFGIKKWKMSDGGIEIYQDLVLLDLPVDMSSEDPLDGLPYKISYVSGSMKVSNFNFKSLQNFPTVVHEDLSLINCVVESLEGIPKIMNNLEFTGVSSLENLNHLESSSIQKVTINHCDDLKSLEGLPEKVLSVNVNQCLKLEKLGGRLVLRELKVSDCPCLTSLESIPEVYGKLDLRGVSIENLKGMHPNPCELHLESCPNLLTLEGIPESLVQLEVVDAEKFGNFDFFPKFVAYHIKMHQCPSIHHVPASLENVLYNTYEWESISCTSWSVHDVWGNSVE